MTADLRTECRKLVDEWPEDWLPGLLRVLEAVRPQSMRKIPPLKFDDTISIGDDVIPVRFASADDTVFFHRWSDGTYSIMPKPDDEPTWTYVELKGMGELTPELWQDWRKQLFPGKIFLDDLPDGVWPESSDSE